MRLGFKVTCTLSVGSSQSLGNLSLNISLLMFIYTTMWKEPKRNAMLRYSGIFEGVCIPVQILLWHFLLKERMSG